MNKMVEETVKNMMQPGERNGEDYIGEDGLLYCGQCHEPKEAYFIVDNAMNRRRLISIRRKSEFWE